jgi:flagellar assembly protein FliH
MSIAVSMDKQATKAVKFLFDEGFGEEELEIDPTAPEAPSPFSNAEVEALQAQAFEAGRVQGLEDARHAAEASIGAVVDRLATEIAALFQDRARIEAALTTEAARLAHAIALKLAQRLMKAHPLSEIERLTEECLKDMADEPRLVIRLHEAMLSPMKGRIETLSAKAGYEGAVILLGDDTLGPLDCRIEWANGGAERRMAPLVRTVEQAVDRFLATKTVSLPEDN